MAADKFDEMFERATREGAAVQPRAVSARYRPAMHKVEIELNNGVILLIPSELIQGLQDGSARQLQDVRIFGRGTAIRWDELDVDMGVPELAAGIFGTQAWMSSLRRAAGRATSEKKAASSRLNGMKGGRPRKAVAKEQRTTSR